MGIETQGLTLLNKHDRARAVRRLSGFGINLPTSASVESVCKRIAEVLHVPCPNDYTECSLMVHRFANHEKFLIEDLPERFRRPFVPLTLSREMLRNMERAREARDAAPSLPAPAPSA